MKLWAITSFFNPMHYRRRLENYRRFRAALDLPLATVELGFGGAFELDAHSAELYLRVGDGDVMWQKERLLNLLIARLPEDCTHVAWLDCDLLPDRGWAAPLGDALARAPLVQAFRRLHYLGPDGGRVKSVDGVAALVEAGADPGEVLGGVTDRIALAPSPGMGWAAERAMIGKNGLYDGCIIGGGDTALAAAGFGVSETVMGLHRMNPHQRRRYHAWAEGLYSDVQGRVAAAGLEISHMWHGELADRQAGERHTGLARHEFDPARDVAPGADGAWRWASAKPEMHAYLRDYFRARQEDGASGVAGGALPL